MSNISLQQIADDLKISRVTVSKVINNKKGVSNETRIKVIEALKKYDYKKVDMNFLTSFSDKQVAKTDCIVIIAKYPEFSEFWMQIINSISQVLDSSNYDLIYSFISSDGESNYILPKLITSGVADGIIIINVYDNEIINDILKIDKSKVFLDLPRGFLNSSFSSDVLLLDGKKSVFEITESIINKGKRNIGFFGDIEYCETTYSRWLGYLEAMNKNGVDVNPEICFTANDEFHFYNMNSVTEAVKSIKVMPDAFVCVNDTIAIMVIDVLSSIGYRVPTDILVSGFDNLKTLKSQQYNLTSVNINPYYVGIRLIEQLLLKIKYPQLPSEIITINSDVIFRDSTNLETLPN